MSSSGLGGRRFARIERLPPYVFNITAELKLAARQRGSAVRTSSIYPWATPMGPRRHTSWRNSSRSRRGLRPMATRLPGAFRACAGRYHIGTAFVTGSRSIPIAKRSSRSTAIRHCAIGPGRTHWHRRTRRAGASSGARHGSIRALAAGRCPIKPAPSTFGRSVTDRFIPYAGDTQPGDIEGDAWGEVWGLRNGFKAFWLRDDYTDTGGNKANAD